MFSGPVKAVMSADARPAMVATASSEQMPPGSKGGMVGVLCFGVEEGDGGGGGEEGEGRGGGGGRGC